MVRRILDGLYLWAGYAAGLCLIIVFLIMLVMSVGRQFQINIPAGDDFASWAMAAMAFLALAHTFRSGEIIRMGLVIEKLTGRRRRIAETGVLLLAIATTGYFTYHACLFTYQSWQFHDVANGVIPVPLWIPQLGFSGGLVILLVAMIDELVHVMRGNDPHYAKAHPTTREEIIERASTGNL